LGAAFDDAAAEASTELECKVVAYLGCPTEHRSHVDPPGENAEIRFSFADGTLSSMVYGTAISPD
jgi:hypothetical protein